MTNFTKGLAVLVLLAGVSACEASKDVVSSAKDAAGDAVAAGKDAAGAAMDKAGEMADGLSLIHI